VHGELALALANGESLEPRLGDFRDGHVPLRPDLNGQIGLRHLHPGDAPSGQVGADLTERTAVEPRHAGAGLRGGGDGVETACEDAQPGEAAAYPAQARNGDSLVAVTAGEQLTERQALEALLLPSADNMAWILARWDAGSQAAFTAQMNTTARQLGMTDTHYTDPSGLSASTTSTAADQVRLGMAALSEPALAQIVALRSAGVGS